MVRYPVLHRERPECDMFKSILLTGMLTGRGQTRRVDGLQGQQTQLSIKRPIDCLLSLERLFLKEFNDEAVTD